MDKAGCIDLAEIMGYEIEQDSALDISLNKELLLDVSNILVGACLNGIAEQLSTTLSYSSPNILAERVPLNKITAAENLNWKHALLVEVNFGLENSEFKSHLLILMEDDAINSLSKSLDQYLESI